MYNKIGVLWVPVKESEIAQVKEGATQHLPRWDKHRA